MPLTEQLLAPLLSVEMFDTSQYGHRWSAICLVYEPVCAAVAQAELKKSNASNGRLGGFLGALVGSSGHWESIVCVFVFCCAFFFFVFIEARGTISFDSELMRLCGLFCGGTCVCVIYVSLAKPDHGQLRLCWDFHHFRVSRNHQQPVC